MFMRKSPVQLLILKIMEIPLEIAILLLLTIYLTAKGIFRYNAKKIALKTKEIKNTFTPKL